jgi:putative transposase
MQTETNGEHDRFDLNRSWAERREQAFAPPVDRNPSLFRNDSRTEAVCMVLNDHQWALLERHLPGKASDCGVTARDNRLFVEAVLWIVRTSSPWRKLPPDFGPWNSAFRRFSRWSRNGVWRRAFAVLASDPDFEYAIVDSTIVGFYHAAGKKKHGLKIAAPAPLRADYQADVVVEPL